jgi:hypothetical protein
LSCSVAAKAASPTILTPLTPDQEKKSLSTARDIVPERVSFKDIEIKIQENERTGRFATGGGELSGDADRAAACGAIEM